MKKIISLILAFAAILCLFSSCGGGTKVPEVYNVSSIEASALIAGVGLVPKIQEEYSHVVEIGNVIRTEPKIGSGVKPGSQVVMYVSKGISPTEDAVGYFIQMIKQRDEEWDDHRIKWDDVSEYAFFDIDSDGLEELILSDPYEYEESWAGKNYYTDFIDIFRINNKNGNIEFIINRSVDRGMLAYSDKLDALVCPSHGDGRIFAFRITPLFDLIDAKCPKLDLSTDVVKDLYYVDIAEDPADKRFNVEYTQSELDELIGNTAPIEFRQISELFSEEVNN